MNYISTRGQAGTAEFGEVLLSGLARDGGLFMPVSWPVFPVEEIASFRDAPYASVAFSVARRFLDASWSDSDIRSAVDAAYATFDDPAVTPLRELAHGEYLLELFHGPTLSFKDIAMQLLAQLFKKALQRRARGGATIVVATSGDTGAAAIHGFRGMEQIDVVVLYPRGRISEVQRRQMTTPEDENVHAVAIEGSFDDCQALVKQCFTDRKLCRDLSLTGVNSINWARIMAQMVYYLVAAAKLGAPQSSPGFTVPTGNFGNIFAGYSCTRMGLPVRRLAIATNANDILARTLDEGIYRPREVVETCAPSMDIQIASNFERLLFDLADGNGAMVRTWMSELKERGSFTLPASILDSLRRWFSAGSAGEEEIFDTIQTVQRQSGIEIDPHTAVGVFVDRRLRADEPAADASPGIVLATAHPVKFPETRIPPTDDARVDSAAERRIEMFMTRPERLHILPAQKSALQEFLRQHSRLGGNQ